MKFIITLIALYTSLNFYQEKPSLEVYNIEKEGGIEVFARNMNDYTVTIELNIELENLKSSKRLPLTEVLAPKSDIKLVELTVRNNTKKWGLETKYSYYMGSILAEHNDSYAYRLPYQLGTDAVVAQGYNGTFSHKGSIAYSIDFNMPEGTQVYAARSGVVVDLNESFTEGGSDEYFADKANFITVVHNDGTFSEYSHLQENGIVVNVGQRIRVGQLLGYSGSTGYATGPHLHFHVKKVSKGGKFVTIPIKFRTQEGVIRVQEKKRYKAL